MNFGKYNYCPHCGNSMIYRTDISTFYWHYYYCSDFPACKHQITVERETKSDGLLGLDTGGLAKFFDDVTKSASENLKFRK